MLCVFGTSWASRCSHLTVSSAAIKGFGTTPAVIKSKNLSSYKVMQACPGGWLVTLIGPGRENIVDMHGGGSVCKSLWTTCGWAHSCTPRWDWGYVCIRSCKTLIILYWLHRSRVTPAAPGRYSIPTKHLHGAACCYQTLQRAQKEGGHFSSPAGVRQLVCQQWRVPVQHGTQLWVPIGGTEVRLPLKWNAWPFQRKELPT